MKLKLILALVMGASLVACTGSSSKANSEEMSQEEIRQTENEINHLDSIANQMENVKNEIETNLLELNQVIEALD